MDDLEDRIYAMVAEERGVRRDRLVPSTTLSGDLGMEGDDAVEFFEQFSRAFNVDTQELEKDWAYYFAPEGVSIWLAFVVIIPSVLIGGFLTQIAPLFPTWACFLVAVVFWWLVFGRWVSWRNKTRAPQITLQDLIDSAKASAWTKKTPAVVLNNSGRSHSLELFP